MKGYALVDVTYEDRKKILELTEKMTNDRQAIYDYYQAKKAAGEYNVRHGWLFKQDCFSPNKAYSDLMSNATFSNELLEIGATMMLCHGILSICETEHGKAIKKIARLSFEDQIYIDDELCNTWNKFIRSEQIHTKDTQCKT